MKKIHLILLGCILGVSACSHLREPDDAQLETLLHREDAIKADASASIDANAVGCLRAWSNEPELTQGLPVRIAGEDGRKSCRTRIDGWIADATRNPDKFSFAELSAPATVRRAMSLLDAHAASEKALGSSAIPSALTRRPVTLPRAPTPDPTVDLGAPGAELADAETLCQQIAAASAEPAASADLRRFAGYCGKSLSKLRRSMEASVKAGRKQADLEAFAVSARNMAHIARDLLTAPK